MENNSLLGVNCHVILRGSVLVALTKRTSRVSVFKAIWVTKLCGTNGTAPDADGNYDGLVSEDLGGKCPRRADELNY